MTHPYPGIAKATIEMSYANGGISRDRREAEVLKELAKLLTSGVDVAMDLTAISLWLGSLSEDDLLIVVDGEESEQQAILKTAPLGTDQLLNHIFEEVV